jgi:hypothetical protein
MKINLDKIIKVHISYGSRLDFLQKKNYLLVYQEINYKNLL